MATMATVKAKRNSSNGILTPILLRCDKASGILVPSSAGGGVGGRAAAMKRQMSKNSPKSINAKPTSKIFCIKITVFLSIFLSETFLTENFGEKDRDNYLTRRRFCQFFK